MTMRRPWKSPDSPDCAQNHVRTGQSDWGMDVPVRTGGWAFQSGLGNSFPICQTGHVRFNLGTCVIRLSRVQNMYNVENQSGTVLVVIVKFDMRDCYYRRLSFIPLTASTSNFNTYTTFSECGAGDATIDLICARHGISSLE